MPLIVLLYINQNVDDVENVNSQNGEVSFGTKLEISSLHVRSASGHLRVSTMASCNMDTFCMPTESTKTLYDLLGISENGTSSEIKKAYKQLARKYHPDVSPHDRIEEHTRRFIMAKEAYDTLSDPHKRQIYDKDLANRSYPFAFSARNESKYDI
ncbi:hypothetical protein Leryth_000825 [Lithospermum erythrorhizon]|nr:hypothetical protein Leryth_000825 [Lithospermum erythrorhizon]